MCASVVFRLFLTIFSSGQVIGSTQADQVLKGGEFLCKSRFGSNFCCRLYNCIPGNVRRSVGPSVGPSVGSNEFQGMLNASEVHVLIIG